jgi:hypothetical protein
MRVSGELFKKCNYHFDFTNFLFIPIVLSLSYQRELDLLHLGLYQLLYIS